MIDHRKGFARRATLMWCVLIVALAAVIFGKLVITPQAKESVQKPDETATWPLYRNEKYGFEFRYPPYLKKHRAGTEDRAALYYCNGTVPPGGDELEVCQGQNYIIKITVYDEELVLNQLRNHYDVPPRLSTGPSGIRKYAMNGKTFYIGKTNAYTFAGWLAHTALDDKTLEIAFHGTGYATHYGITEMSDEELEAITKVLHTFQIFTPRGATIKTESPKLTDDARLHTTCNLLNPCPAPMKCVSYYGYAGPRGPLFQTCEIPCPSGQLQCPIGLTCTVINDGPGKVCSK